MSSSSMTMIASNPVLSDEKKIIPSLVCSLFCCPKGICLIFYLSKLNLPVQTCPSDWCWNNLGAIEDDDLKAEMTISSYLEKWDNISPLLLRHAHSCYIEIMPLFILTLQMFRGTTSQRRKTVHKLCSMYCFPSLCTSWKQVMISYSITFRMFPF